METDVTTDDAPKGSAQALPHGESASPPSRAGVWIRRLLLALAALALLVLGRQAGAYVAEAARWIEGFGPWSAAAYVAAYALATVAFIPGSGMTLAGGVIFGLARGTAYTVIGATVGAALAFLVSRYLARGRIERLLTGDERFATIDGAIGRQGLKITLLLRLSPVFPFNLLNYALGLTTVKFRDYLIASVGMIPGTLLYVYYGTVLGDLAALAGGVESAKGPADYALLGVGLAATAAVTIVITRIARRALKEETDA